jgi:dihydroflavonol-4-reductase
VAERVGTFEKTVYTSSAMILERNGENRSPAYRFMDTTEETFGPYSRSKLLAGKAVLQAAEEGLPVVLVAPTVPIGPGDARFTPPTRLLLNILNGKIKALYDCQLNLVDVRDVAEGHIRAEQFGKIGRIYPLAGENLTLSQLFQQVAEMTGVKVPRIKVPYLLALWFAWLSEFIAGHITQKYPLATMAGVKRAQKPLWFDKAETSDELKMHFRPPDISLFDAIQDLLQRGLIDRSIKLKNPEARPKQ